MIEREALTVFICFVIVFIDSFIRIVLCCKKNGCIEEVIQVSVFVFIMVSFLCLYFVCGGMRYYTLITSTFIGVIGTWRVK